MANIELLDVVAIVQSGRLVYFGPPTALLEFFGTRSYEGVFKRLAEDSPLAWQEKFRRTPFYQQFVLSRMRKVTP
jgi:ABC-type multidrug transport system ATPase subunit